MKKPRKIKAADGDTTYDTRYSEDTQVHKPKVTDLPAPRGNAPEKKDSISTSPEVPGVKDEKPGSDAHLAEPLRYIVSPTDAIEKVETLLEKVKEGRPDLMNQVDTILKSVDELEKNAWGEGKTPATPSVGSVGAPGQESPGDIPQELSPGSSVEVQAEEETYRGILVDMNEDGTWDVQTDQNMVLSAVPPEAIRIVQAESFMSLPAAQRLQKLMLTAGTADEFTRLRGMISAVELGEFLEQHSPEELDTLISNWKSGLTEVGGALEDPEFIQNAINEAEKMKNKKSVNAKLAPKIQAAAEVGQTYLDGPEPDGHTFTIVDKGSAKEMTAKYPAAWEEAKKQMSNDQWSIFLKMPDTVCAVHYDGFDEGDLSLVTEAYVNDCQIEGKLKSKIKASAQIQLKETPTALEMTADPETQEWLKEVVAEKGGEVSSQTEAEVLDNVLGNTSLDWISPEEIGALTSAPILGEVERADSGEIISVISAYWFPDYQVRSFVEDLIETGKATFPKAPETEKKDLKAAKKRTPVIPADYPAQPLKPGEAAEDRATCGTCGLSWDDSIPTSMTPAPSGRCPFEVYHNEDVSTQETSEADENALNRRIVEILESHPDGDLPYSGAKAQALKELKRKKGKLKGSRIKAELEPGYEPTQAMVINEGGKVRAFDADKDDTQPSEVYKNADGKLAVVSPDGSVDYEDKANDEVELNFFKELHALVGGGAEERVPVAASKIKADEEIPKEEIPEEGMKKVAEFEFEDIGIEHSQYYTGRGTSPENKFDDVFTGIGMNYVEACEDALEQAAMQGYEISPDMEAAAHPADVDATQDAVRDYILKTMPEVGEDELDEVMTDVEVYYHVALYVKKELGAGGESPVKASFRGNKETLKAHVDRAIAARKELLMKIPKIEASAFDSIPELDLGEGFKVRRKKGTEKKKDEKPAEGKAPVAKTGEEPAKPAAKDKKPGGAAPAAMPAPAPGGIAPMASLEAAEFPPKDEKPKDEKPKEGKDEKEPKEPKGEKPAKDEKKPEEKEFTGPMLEVTDADGKVVGTYPDAFGDDTVAIIKFLQAILPSIKKGEKKEEKKDEKKDEKKEETKEEGKDKKEKKEEDSIKDKPKALPSVKVEKKDEEAMKAAQRLTEERILMARNILKELAGKNYIVADQKDIDEELLKQEKGKESLEAAMNVAYDKASDRKFREILAMPDAELLTLRASLPNLQIKAARIEITASTEGLEPLDILTVRAEQAAQAGQGLSVGAAFSSGFGRG